MNAQARKNYKVGGYRLRLKRWTMRLKNDVGELMHKAGVVSFDALFGQVCEEIVSTLSEKKLLHPLYCAILEFDDRTILHRWWREWRMKRTGKTLQSIVQEVATAEEVELFQAFFIEQLGAQVLFSNSVRTMGSSWKQMQEEMKSLFPQGNGITFTP